MTSSHLLTDIGTLVINTPRDGSRPVIGDLGTWTDAAVVVEDGLIAWIGAASDAPAANTVTRVGGRSVIPGFVDSHSHVLFAGDRSAEFEARMAGSRYSAGGIRSTVTATRAASDDELLANAQHLLSQAHAHGTTTLEIKSGYGLDLATEERLVRLAAQLTDEVTYLGAHVVPTEYAERREEYIDLVIGDMLDACASCPLDRRLLRDRSLHPQRIAPDPSRWARSRSGRARAREPARPGRGRSTRRRA